MFEPKALISNISRNGPRACALLLAALGMSACAAQEVSEFGFATGPLMKPGDNCLRCHRSERSDYPSAPPWSAAGTVFPGTDSPQTDGVEGVSVIFSDEAGNLIETLTTNAAGNFYTNKPMPTGFRVALEYEAERIEMPCTPPAGNCGACHTTPAIGGTRGRMFIPQAPEAADVLPMCAGFGP